MAGQIHLAIEKIINSRSNGNAALAQTTMTKLLMKGIDASKWNASSPDDPAILAKVKQAGSQLGVTI
jgi:GH25 family lysozyme M1 (1,4-beta-N-acetylmuramidase)